MRFVHWMPTLALCALPLAPARGILAQAPRRELVGIVRDQDGAPVEGATIEVNGAVTRTTEKGTFQLFTIAIDTVTISIHRIGYSPLEALITARNRQWDTVAVELERTSVTLASIKINEKQTRLGLKTFDERRKLGNGQFVDRAEIVSRGSSRLSDVLQNKRGTHLVKLGFGRYGLRFASYNGKGNSCPPDIWIDGAKARGMEIDDITANTIEAIELYDAFATLPFEFTHTSSALPCGTVVLWSRVPNSKEP